MSTTMTEQTKDNVRSFVAFLIVLLLIAWVTCAPASAQSPTVVFQSAYQRSFAVTNCTNANPIVVTIQAPASNEVLSIVPLEDGVEVTIVGVRGNTACNVTDAVINVLTATTFELTGVAGNGDYINGGTGTSDTVIDNLPSPPMPNEGQGGHLISVEFPNAAATVTGIQVRIEAADTCPDPPFCTSGDWRPISDDVTTVALVGSTYYQFVRANGAWRAIRVNSIIAIPGSEPMRVDYTGMPFPIGSVISLGDRFELTTPFGGSYGGGLEFVAGACQDGTAAGAFNSGSSFPEAQCISSNQNLAVLAFDTTVTECKEDAFLLAPQGTPGQMSATFVWQASNTGTLQWSMEHVCLRAGSQLGAAAYSAATTVTGTAGAANQLIYTTMQVPLTSCIASDLLFFRFCRTGATGTLAVDALLKSLRLTPTQ